MKFTSTLLLLFGIAISNSLFSQNDTSKKSTSIATPNNQERYKIDYELKDYTFINGDSTILSLLDLESIEYLREQTQDVEVTDSVNGVIIILFYEKKNPNQNPTILIEKL